MNASKVPSRTVDKYDLSTRIIPGQKAFSLFTRRSNHRPIHGFRLRRLEPTTNHPPFKQNSCLRQCLSSGQTGRKSDIGRAGAPGSAAWPHFGPIERMLTESGTFVARGLYPECSARREAGVQLMSSSYTVGYIIGSLSAESINRTLSKALI